jgi:DNA-binding transcriptional LysR family regulator
METAKVDGPLSSNDGTAVLQWALDGRGVAVRSQWETETLVRDGKLVVLLND